MLSLEPVYTVLFLGSALDLQILLHVLAFRISLVFMLPKSAQYSFCAWVVPTVVFSPFTEAFICNTALIVLTGRGSRICQ